MGLVSLMGSAGKGGSLRARIGYGDFVYSFFSTVSYHLEVQGNWGKKTGDGSLSCSLKNGSKYSNDIEPSPVF